MIKPEDVTIIIPHLWPETKETEFALEYCIHSLIETAPEIKKLIVYNGVTDLSSWGDYTARWEGSLNISVMMLQEQGQCKAVNAAVATVITPWVLVTNDDMVYPPGWSRELFVVGVTPNVLCVSPKLVEPRSGAPTFLEYFCGGAGGDFDKQKFLEFAKAQVQVGSWKNSHQTGFNLPFLIRKDLWDMVGGYDINYDPWGSNSDSDLEYKIKLAGVQPMQAQYSLVYHFSQTSGTFEPKNQAAWQRNWDYFIAKWGFPRTDNGIWEASFTIPTKDQGRIFNPDWEGKYVV